jgi:tetratricopeptide (TPR) repeat protein
MPVYGQKKKKKEPEPTKLKKAYHDLTHKYNSYFNADLKMQEVVKGMETQHQENYNQILPMYKYLALEGASAPSSDLDVIIKKAGVAISIHRMSHWTDDSYLLIGQSEYLKGKLPEAEATFKYIISELDPKKLAEAEAKRKGKGKKKKGKKKKTTTKKKKKGGMTKVKRPKDRFGNPIEPKAEDKPKEEVKPVVKKDEEKESSYILKHRPAHKEAFLWLAKTQIATEKYDEAYIVLNRLRRDKGVSDEVLAEVEATEAYAYLKLKEYEKAVRPLERAIELSKDRKQKLRYTYILGQLHQRAGRGEEAYATYEKVLKLRPIYEMEFNTRLSIAKNAYENGDGSIDDAIRDLEKMLKDEKNEEYLDQVYFAMADIELKRDNKTIAIDYLKKSVYNNLNNKPQKAEAYYLLAELYYDIEIYTNSKYYYDSTLTALADNDERKDKVTSRSINLKEIAENIEIITLQDSLIRISNMNDEERMVLALKIREDDLKKQKAEKKGKAAKGRRQMTAAVQQKARGGRNTENVGTWWAYDSDNIRKGKREFEKLWGQRKLTDNWRRSNRKGSGLENDEIATVDGSFAELTSTEVDAIFSKMGVPNTELKVKQTEDEIAESMAALGPLYRDRLKNNPKAINVLERLMTRFPKNKYRMESAYLLYVMYNEKPNFTKANYYKELILKADKDSKFAKAIMDDKFLEKENLRLTRIQDYYNNAYELFEKGNAKVALDKIDNVDKMFKPKENPLKAKFTLLAALCEGRLNGKEAYKIGLNEVVKTYPKTDEAKKAAEILKYLGDDSAVSANPIKKVKDGLFSGDDGTHFFIATYNAELLNRNDITAKFSDYNKKYHSLERLRVNSIYLDLKTPVLVVKRFKNKDEAMMYYDKVNENVEEYLKESMEGLEITPMVISQDNYKTLVRKKAMEDYKLFFEVNYK